MNTRIKLDRFILKGISFFDKKSVVQLLISYMILDKKRKRGKILFGTITNMI